MHLHLGNLHIDNGDYESAIKSFEHARVKFRDHMDRPPLIVSLVYPLLPCSVLTLIPFLIDYGVEL